MYVVAIPQHVKDKPHPLVASRTAKDLGGFYRGDIHTEETCYSTSRDELEFDWRTSVSTLYAKLNTKEEVIVVRTSTTTRTVTFVLLYIPAVSL